MRKIHLKTASMLIPVRKMATFPYSKWLLSASEEHLEPPLFLRVAEEGRGTWPLPSGHRTARNSSCPETEAGSVQRKMRCFRVLATEVLWLVLGAGRGNSEAWCCAQVHQQFGNYSSPQTHLPASSVSAAWFPLSSKGHIWLCSSWRGLPSLPAAMPIHGTHTNSRILNKRVILPI